MIPKYMFSLSIRRMKLLTIKSFLFHSLAPCAQCQPNLVFFILYITIYLGQSLEVMWPIAKSIQLPSYTITTLITFSHVRSQVGLVFLWFLITKFSKRCSFIHPILGWQVLVQDPYYPFALTLHFDDLFYVNE